MSWHSQVEPAIIQGDFWQVSQFYQELIEREPLEGRRSTNYLVIRPQSRG